MQVGIPQTDSIPSKIQSDENLEKVTETDSISSEDITKIQEERGSDIDENKIYGQYLMRNNNVKIIEQSSGLKPPDSYILGAGDEISISVFGRSQFEEKYEVRKDGYIHILNGRQRVQIAGLTLGTVKDKLYTILSNYYSFQRSEYQLTLAYSRTINIGIYGEVFKVGHFKMNAYNNAFNALAAIKGPTDKGSLRNIQLIKTDGTSKRVDIYEILNNPQKAEQLYLDDNDLIHVPIHKKVIKITGAINRPMRYELLEQDDLEDLIRFAGGLLPASNTKIFKLERFKNNDKQVVDIPYEELKRRGQSFALRNGDVVSIDSIQGVVQNFIQVNGEVLQKGRFQRFANMKLADLLLKIGLKPESRTDLALLVRKNSDGTKTYLLPVLDDILNNANSSDNYILANEDELTIWAKSRFEDDRTFTVSGAVRIPDEYPYGSNNSIKIIDAIALAGGLRRDAGKKALIHRQDPLIPNVKQYVQIDIEDVINNPDSEENISLQAFDNLNILSDNIFVEETKISVSGAVNNPGEFKYGENMTVSDALLLAKGFTISASTNNIEISRVIIEDNTATKTVVANLAINRNYQDIGQNDEANFVLQPYDNIIVREVPEFEFQRNVNIVGEVKYPGKYPLLSNNEKLSSIIERAGGLTEEAFPAGAKLYREYEQEGYIIMRLNEALENKQSRYNFILKESDQVTIPKQRDFVTIQGATRVDEVIDETVVAENNRIQVPFHKGKNAKFYIDYYAGGISENGRKSLIYVEHPNGEIKQTKRKFPFGLKYPEVKKGSKITVGIPPPEPIKDPSEKTETDWTKILGDSVAQAMSILTLILLVQRLD